MGPPPGMRGPHPGMRGPPPMGRGFPQGMMRGIVYVDSCIV